MFDNQKIKIRTRHTLESGQMLVESKHERKKLHKAKSVPDLRRPRRYS